MGKGWVGDEGKQGEGKGGERRGGIEKRLEEGEEVGDMLGREEKRTISKDEGKEGCGGDA